MDKSDYIFKEYEDILDKFIDRISTIKKYIESTGYDIDEAKKLFIKYIRDNNETDVLKYNFIVMGSTYNPLCDIIRMFKNESSEEVDRILGIILDFTKYTQDVVKDEYNNYKDAIGPYFGGIIEDLRYSIDKSVSYMNLSKNIREYFELKCRWRMQDTLMFEVMTRYKHLFSILIFPMCAKCSYDYFRCNLS